MEDIVNLHLRRKRSAILFRSSKSDSMRLTHIPLSCGGLKVIMIQVAYIRVH